MSVYSIIKEVEGPEKAILRALKDSPDGLNIRMISEKIGMIQSWVNRYINKLVEQGKIRERKIGRSRVFFIKSWRV